MTKFKIKNKTTKRGGGRLVGRFSRALGAFSHSHVRNKLRQPFNITAATGKIAPMEFGKKKQQPIASNHNIHIDDSMRSKSDTGTIIKVVTGTLIAAFLSILFAKSTLGAELKSNIDDLVKETTNAVYKYMVNHTSEIIQEGDTTIIASLYKTIVPEERKKIFKHLVIGDVSYGWLAEYDDIIETWLNKVIEIKGGLLPSDKYITNVINIIQNKVLPVTNGIWYSKRAIRRATGLGLTKADIVPDSYWYTLEGQAETAHGARQTLAEDTTLAKIIVGLLTAIEWYNDTNPTKNIFGVGTDIKAMLHKLVIKFKADIMANRGSVDLELFRKQAALYPFKIISGNASTSTNAKIRELNEEVKKLEKINQQLVQPSHFPQWNLKPKPNDTAMASDIATQMQNMGAFDPYKGGVRRRGSTRKQHVNKHKHKNVL
jgi:hypothetical protein